MNIVQYHKKFREVAIKRNMVKKQQFILNESKAQRRFNFLNEEANQAEFNERVRKATADLIKAFDAFADGIRKNKEAMKHASDAIAYEQPAKRAGKTQRIQEKIDRFKRAYGFIEPEFKEFKDIIPNDASIRAAFKTDNEDLNLSD